MKLNIKTKIAYGVTAIADQCLFYSYGTFFMFFLTTVAGISPATAGIISAIGAIWDALVAPVAGYISDNTHSRWGKRKPITMGFAFPMAVTTALMFTYVDMAMPLRIAYYTVITMLFWTAFPMFFIPFLAWGAELTEDYTERTTLRSYAYVGNTAGMAIGTLLPTVMVDYLIRLGKSDVVAWQLAMLLVAVCVGLVLFFGPMPIKAVSTALTKEERLARIKEKRFKEKASLISKLNHIISEFGQVLKLKALVIILTASILYLMASTIFASDRMYFFTYNMKLSTTETSMLMAVATFSGVLLLPAISATKNVADKKTQYIVGICGCSAVMCLFRFLAPTDMTAGILVMFAFGVSNMLYWQLLPAMLYDVCEVDELISGKQRQGTIVSLQSLVESVSEAVGMLALGFVLELAGFSAELTHQTASALFWVSNCFTLVPVVFMLASAIMIFIYPITSKNFAKILEAVERQRKGETVDLSKFNGII